MDTANKKLFSLHALLRLKDLNLEKVGKKNPSLRVDDYFGLLSNLINNMDMMRNALDNFSDIDSTSNDINIAFIKNLLDDIGCNNFAPIIKDIIDSKKRGHKDFAATCAKKLLEGITELHAKILTAEKKETDDDNEYRENTDDNHKQFLPLKMVLTMLDQEEATRKLRILAIDDSPVILKAITSVLNDDQYKVFTLSNPLFLEKFLQQVTPDLFLLDYKMPELNGFELVPIIRKFDEHKDTPIIFLTAMRTVDHLSAALALGACDFIVKPFQDNILREKITKHIVRKKPY